MDSLLHDLQKHIAGEVRFDPLSRMLYSTDASIYQIEPLGVVIPRHADDVQATVQVAREHGVPVLPRGGGTGPVSNPLISDGFQVSFPQPNM